MQPSPGPELQSFIEAFRAVRTRRGRQARGCFSLEGTRLVERAVRADWPLQAVLVSEDFGNTEREKTLLAVLREQGVPRLVSRRLEMAPLLEGRTYGEILGLATLRETSLAELHADDASERSGDPPLILGAVDIEDPGNTGALIRTAHAIGAAAVLGIGLTQAFHPKAVRTSMGSLFRLPVFEFESLEGALHALPPSWVTVAASSRADALEIPLGLRSLHLPGPTCLLVGNEAQGLDEATHRRVDHALRIPMPDRAVDSFSVNAAAAILLYALRTRHLD